MKILKQILFVAILTVLAMISSCKKAEEQTGIDMRNKVIIVNEGPFQTGSGSIGLLDRSSGSLTSGVFAAVNGREIGNLLQSALILDSKLYLAVNGANKIEIMEESGANSAGRIEDVPSPRFMAAYGSDKIFVSCWDNTVKVINTTDKQVINSIPAGEGPEKMLAFSNKLYVLNKGGYGNDSTITLIDMQQESVISTISVGGRPADIVLDKNQHLWVLCSGIGWNGFPSQGDTRASLICIDPADDSILKIIEFSDTEHHPENLAINAEGDKLFYNYTDGIYEFDISSSGIQNGPLVSRNSMFYGLGCDPLEDILYAADAVDFTQKGWIYRYHAYNGSLIDSLKAGIAPNGFIFN